VPERRCASKSGGTNCKIDRDVLLARNVHSLLSMNGHVWRAEVEWGEKVEIIVRCVRCPLGV